MITRIPTFKDYSKIAELINNTELVAQWIIYGKDNKNILSLITIEKKKVIAVLFCEYFAQDKLIDVVLFVFPLDKPEIGKFLIDKAIKHFKEQNNEVQFVRVVGLFTQHEQYQKMNMKPQETTYLLESD